jgi:hypothetical protein
MTRIARKPAKFEVVLVLHLAVAFVAALTRPVCAQTGDEWIGKRVITKTGVILRVGKSLVDDRSDAARKDARTYRVEQVIY